jgi:predicted aspartyl protease
MPSARRAQGAEQLRTRQAFFRAALESARDRSINNIRINHLIKLTVFVKDVQLKALLDSGAQGNYISRTAADRARLSPQYKKNPYPLQVANGELMPGEDKVTLKV